MTGSLQRRFSACAAAAALAVTALAAAPAWAADYPEQAIRIVVANTPGSSVDSIARHLAEHVSKQMGQSMFIDNRPGAGGMIGSQHLARSAPDGYTLGIISSSHVIMPHLHETLNFDPLGDIQPVALVGSLPLVLVTAPGSPYKTVNALLEAARQEPGKLTYGSPGVGTALHLAGVQVQSLTDTQFLHVPYKGVGPLLVDVMANTIDAAVLTVGSAARHIEDGKLNALAVSSPTSLLPNVPTLAEAGVPGFDFESWIAVIAPAGIPAQALARWNQDVSHAVQDEAFQRVLMNNGLTPKFMDSDETTAFMRDDYARSGELVRAAAGSTK